MIIRLLLCSPVFEKLPIEIFCEIINLCSPFKYLTVFNVSRFSVVYRSSAFQVNRSVIPPDSIQVRYFARNDFVQLCCGTWRKLSDQQSTIVFALGSKLPGWLWLLRQRKHCLIV